MVSNPPYVEADELDSLEPEVREWEPRGALVDDGQTARLVREAAQVLAGWLVLEVHEARASESRASSNERGIRASAITNDLAGKERVVEAWWGTTVDRVIDGGPGRACRCCSRPTRSTGSRRALIARSTHRVSTG